MGHKKRTLKSTDFTTATATTAGPSPAAMEAVKSECDRALVAIRRGNHTKALRLMKEICNRFETSAVVHRVSGAISVKVAGILDDPSAKQRHYRNAIESVKRAVSLSPNSLELACFYANLLYELATDSKDYEQVMSECERALSIENPSDPAKENPFFSPEEKIEMTAETRIGNIQQELRGLVQKSNIASISSWMKNLGGPGGDDKFRLTSLRRFPEDPIESRFLNSGSQNVRRPNEIKKATKTPEERRKEIEVRVAAARLLQQKSEHGSGRSSDESRVESLECKGSLVPKVGERRRHGNSKRNGTISERKDQVKSFWNTMDYELKRGLLRVNISDLRAHFSNKFKDGGPASEILHEALAFGELNKSWKFWACCRCGERFPDSESHIQHVIQKHMGNLLPKIQSAVPPNVDNEWSEMLVSSSWKPLDLSASVRMLEDQLKPEGSESFGMSDPREQINDCWSDSLRSDEAWQSFTAKNSIADNCNGHEDKFDIVCKTCEGSDRSMGYNLPRSWPLSGDTERAKLLEKISILFEILISHKYLAMSHLRKVIHFTMEELQGIVPGSQILSCGVDQTPLCICFLGAAPLRKIIKFLQEMSHSCGLSRYPEKVTREEASCLLQDCEDRIMLSEDALTLLLDETLLPRDSVRDDVLSGRPIGSSENDAQSEGDSLLSWVYAGPPSGEHVASWSKIREDKANQGMDVFGMLEKEFGNLQHLCEKKYGHLAYEEALQGLEDLVLQESKKREHGTEYIFCSYDLILRKRKDELIEGENEVTFARNRLELDAISNVLKDAENINVNQFGFDDTYGGVTSHLCDLEAGEDWKSNNYINQMDTCIDIALHSQKEQLCVEFCKLDAGILRSFTARRQLEHKLELVSAFDYRFILVPLVKSFLQAHLEDLAEKDATEKSDAAREAFLAELALDTKKDTSNGNCNSKNPHEKMKDKRKNKECRRYKDSKIGSYSEQHDSAEQPSLATTCDGDNLDTDMVITESGVNVDILDNEFRRKFELETEERKLEERLEYQRQMENEAKQRLLDEQCRRNSIRVADAFRYKHEQLVLKDAFVDNLNAAQRKLNGEFDLSAIADDKCSGSATGCQNGSADEGDEVFILERWAGKKGKRRSSLKVHDEHYQAVSYGQENVEILTLDALQKGHSQKTHNQDDTPVGDGGSKTLKQLHAEEDDEERFQADLKKAVQESLDTFQAHQKPLSNSRVVPKNLLDPESLGDQAVEVSSDSTKETGAIGAGLQNEVGEYNCFLNVIIQSLWHLRRFRKEFLRRATEEHIHVGDPCVVCALFEILSELSMASLDRETVAPTSLRIALSNLCPENNFFQEGQMNDASEVLGVIFECLHRSFTTGSGGTDSDSIDCSRLGSWDCTSPLCTAHSLFGMDISERMNCYSCGLESRHLKYTSFFHNVNARALRTMKVMCADSSFDELLNLVEMNHQLACDREVGGCGLLNHVHHILSYTPHVFTTVLGWQNTCESVDDIKATLAALETEIDISVLYRGLDPNNLYRLVSVVCYYGQHYHCFAYSHDHERWVMYDDKTVKVIGTWDDVLYMCERGHLQPQVLFYEAVN